MPDFEPLDPMEVLGIPREALPRHVAIIMDGNGRWAKQRGLPRTEGHKVGVDSVREIIRHCGRLGIEYLTLYSFSSENWRRPPEEVAALMSLYALHLVCERDDIMRNGVRMQQIGSREGLPPEVIQAMDETKAMSEGNESVTVSLALNYGSRREIVEGVREIATKVAAGELKPEDIDESTISDSLYTAGMPDPDLLIRTAGEMRISNFLLWQISYAELYVTDVMWPEFRAEQFNDALRHFGRRERRFGDVQPGGASTT